ncbi:MAG: hypothetical protein HY670_09950 [Chloroflexi bacterium]|nr:hypothetical protein [Chloroflexota bacterium]
MENAGVAIHNGDTEKAGEFVWGSLSQALKAVAASRGILFRSHRKLKEYALELAREIHDNSISDTFDRASLLHTNFYESDLELKDVIRITSDVKTTIGRLLGLIPKSTQESKNQA